MTKIELPASHTVTKGPRDKAWLASVAVDVTALSADIVAKLAIHGLHQKVADAASGAQNEAEALASMQKAVDALLAGEWSSRSGGEGVSEETRVARQITREVLKTKLGGKSPEWQEFTGQDDATQAKRLDDLFAKNEAKLRPAVDAKLAELAEARKRKAGLAADFAI